MQLNLSSRVINIPFNGIRNISYSRSLLSSEKRHVDEETWNKARPTSEIPGPRSLPIIRNTWRFLPKIGEFSRNDPGQFLPLLHKRYGEIVKLDGIHGMLDSIHIFNPEDVEMIYKLEGIMPERTIFPSFTYFRDNYMQDIFKDAKGLISSNGQDWYHFRNKVNTIMMQPKAGKQYIPVIDDIAKDFVVSIENNLNKDNRFHGDFWRETNKWALESIASIALDGRLNLMKKNIPEDDPAYKLMEITEKIFMFTQKLDFSPNLWKFYATKTFKQAMITYQDQIKISQQFIDKALQTIQDGKNDSEDMSVLNKLLKVDPKVAVVMTTDMLLAGVDSTSISLINALYYLSKNTDKQDVLRKEIETVLTDKDTKLTSTSLNSLHYLKACIKEASRLYPVTPGTMRILTKDVVIRGYRVPKGWNVLFPHMYLSIMDGQFPRPNEYLPERWLRENVDSDISYKRAHPFCSLPFGFGSRSCIGKRFAELELEIGLATVIKNFKVTWDGPPPTRAFAGFNHLREPYNFVFKKI